MRIVRAASAIAIALVATPAAAVRYDLFVQGALAVSPVTNGIIGLNFGTGDQILAHWRIDTSAPGFIGIAPVGGAGTAGFFTNIVSQGRILIAGNGGSNPVLLTQTMASFGALLAVDNGSVPGLPPGLRFDQIGINDGLSFPLGTPNYGYAISGAVPANLFVQSILYSRSAVGPAGSPPALVALPGLPDLVNGWQPFASPLTFQLTFRDGTPGNAADAALLPTTVFSVFPQSAQIVFLPDVPEPGTWALLIAGFGLVGAALRVQRTGRRGAAIAPV